MIEDYYKWAIAQLQINPDADADYLFDLSGPVTDEQENEVFKALDQWEDIKHTVTRKIV